MTERCVDCGEPTGRLGAEVDSLYCIGCDAGPLCESCYDKHAAKERLGYPATGVWNPDDQRKATS